MQKKNKTPGVHHPHQWDGSESELLIAIRVKGSTWASITRDYFPHWTERDLTAKFKTLIAKYPESKVRFEELFEIKHSEELETIVTRTWSRVRERREHQGDNQQQHKGWEQS